jgi:hypothetical protein
MGKKQGKSNRAKQPVGGVPSPLQEALAQLDRMKQNMSGSQIRLHADIARDTVVELARDMETQLRRLAAEKRKVQKQCDDFRNRLVELLHDLSTGPVILPRTPGKPVVQHDQLLMTYRQLRNQDFLGLAQAIHAASGKGDVPAYQRYLVNEVLVNGSRILVENIVRHSGAGRNEADEEAFLGRLRHHVAGNVCNGLARKAKYQVTPDVGQHVERLLVSVLGFLTDLLTATPPGRLLLPRDGSAFDPERHEAIYGRPSTGELKVTATLFPGYVVLGNPVRVLEKAQVYTDKVQSPTPIEPPDAT